MAAIAPSLATSRKTTHYLSSPQPGVLSRTKVKIKQ